MTRASVIACAAALALAVTASGTFVRAEQRDADGTAELAGTVVTAGSSAAPLARVLVTLSGGPLTASRTVISDERGAFVFRNLPAGSFTVVATRAPFVTTAFGAKRPGRPGTPIAVLGGQHIGGITIALTRGAAITGMVRHLDGDPAAGVDVEVRSATALMDPRTSRVVTDDRGVFRAFGLEPGKYYVSASSRDLNRQVTRPVTDAELDERFDRLRRRGAPPAPGAAPATAPTVTGPPPPAFRYAPVYYPGTSDLEQAIPVTLAEGEERPGIDISLVLTRALTIEGTLASATGGAAGSANITVRRRPARGFTVDPASNVAMGTRVDANGRFTIANLLPGTYRLVANSMTLVPATAGRGGGANPQTMTMTDATWAMVDIPLSNFDVRNVAMTLRPALQVRGRVVYESATGAAPPAPGALRLRLTDTTGSMPSPGGTDGSDGTLTFYNTLPGLYVLEAVSGLGNWRLRSAVTRGRDILDVPFELGADDAVDDLVVTLTDTHTTLNGTLQSASNTPATGYFVVVFTTERAFWRPGSRRVQFTRPGTDGRFAFRDLPAGDYRIAALTDLEAADLIDPSFMDALVPASVPVVVRDGDTTTQDLRLR